MRRNAIAVEIDREEQVLNLLKQAGLRKTEKRKEILKELLMKGRPLSHSDLLECETIEHIDRVTLYRNLTALEKGGIIHSILGEDGTRRFRAHQVNQPGCPGNHPHFVCLSCKTMICLTDQKLPKVRVPEGYRVIGKRFIVYGICSECGGE